MASNDKSKNSSPDMTTPMMKGGTPVCSYETTGYRAMLVKNPQSLNPNLEFPHALLVYPAEDYEPPFIYIVAEKAHLPANEIAALPAEFQKYIGNDVFITVYSQAARANLGSNNDYAILEIFEKKALSVMRERLNIISPINAINDTRKGGSFPGGDSSRNSGCFGVIFAGIGLASVLSFGFGYW